MYANEDCTTIFSNIAKKVDITLEDESNLKIDVRNNQSNTEHLLIREGSIQ